jgi:hypothetical protein
VWREEEQAPQVEEVAGASDEEGSPFPGLVEEAPGEGEGEGEGGEEEEEEEEDDDDDLRASLQAFARDEARALADEGSDRLPLWPADAGGSPAPVTTTGAAASSSSPAPAARRAAPPGPSALPALFWDQSAATLPLPTRAGPHHGKDESAHLRRIKEALLGRRQRRQQQQRRRELPSSSEEEEENDAQLLSSLRDLLAGLRDAEDEPLLAAARSAGRPPPPPEYNRVAGPALWAMLEGLLGHEEEEMVAGAESDEEDDLIRCLLAGAGERDGAGSSSHQQQAQQGQGEPAPGGGAAAPPSSSSHTAFPTLAAAERRRRALLSEARFLRVGFPTLTLLQGDRPPKRLLLRYAPPPPALLPAGLRGPRVDAAMVRGPGGDSAFSKLHPGSYVPERLPPTLHRGGRATNPLALLVELDDAALARWLGEGAGAGDKAAEAPAALAVEVLVPLATLDRRSRDALLRAHPKPHPPEQPLLVARAALPLRNLLATPGLSLGTTLELSPTAAAAAVWKTGKGRGGRPLLGTLAVECALIDTPTPTPTTGPSVVPSRPPSPRFAPSSSASASSFCGEEEEEGAATTDKGGSAFPPSPRRPDFSASSPLRRFHAAGAGGGAAAVFVADRLAQSSSLGFGERSSAGATAEAAAADTAAPKAADPLRLLLHAGRVWGPALRGLGEHETLRLRYKGEAAVAAAAPQWREARAGPADSTGQNASACASLRDFGHEVVLPCGAALSGWLEEVGAGRGPPALSPMVLELWTGAVASQEEEEGEEKGDDVEAKEEGRLLGLVKLQVSPAAEALVRAARPASRLLPFVGTEGPQPVVNPFDGRVVAHVEACVALGTEEQLGRLSRTRAPLRRLQARVRGALCRGDRRRRRRRQKEEQERGEAEQQGAGSMTSADARKEEEEERGETPPRTRPLRLRELLERAEASTAAMAASTASQSASQHGRLGAVALSEQGEAAAGAGDEEEEDDVSIGELLDRRRWRASAASSVSASHRARSGAGVHGRAEEPFGLSGEDEGSLGRSASHWSLLGGGSSSARGPGGMGMGMGMGIGVAPQDDLAAAHGHAGSAASLAAAAGATGGGGGGERVKHVLDVSVAGECRLEWAPRAPVPPNLACYVRYLVRRSPLHALLGEAGSLSRHQDEAFLTAAGGLGPAPPGADGSICSLLASAASPVSDPAGWQAVCLWWDLEDCDLNSRARHVLHTAWAEEEDDGQAAAAALCGGEGLRLQVGVTGLEGGHGPARLIGTARVGHAQLAQLMRRETGVWTLRLEVEGPEETSITSPPPPVRVRTLDLGLSYYREPHLVSRLRRSRGALAVASGGASGAAAVATGAPGGGLAGPGSGTLLTGLGLGEEGESRSRLLYGESTVVDRVLPRTGRLCVELLDLTGPWPPRALSAIPSPALFLEYDIETGGQAEGEGEGEERRRRRFSHRLPTTTPSRSDPSGGAVHFLDVFEVRLDEAFMEALFAGPLELRLVTAGTEVGERVLLATLQVPLREVLTRLTGVSGVFPWCWRPPQAHDAGAGEGGGARVAVYFQHQKPFLPGHSDDDDDHDDGGGGGGPSGGRGGGGDSGWGGGEGGGGVDESKRGGSGEGRGLFSLTRFGSTHSGAGGGGGGIGVTEAILEHGGEAGEELEEVDRPSGGGALASSFASLLEASTASRVSSSSSAIAAAVEGLLVSLDGSSTCGRVEDRRRGAAVVAPLDGQGLAAVQGLVSELSVLDRSLLSSFGGEELGREDAAAAPLAASREQGVQTDGEEGETTITTTSAPVTATSGTSSSSGGGGGDRSSSSGRGGGGGGGDKTLSSAAPQGKRGVLLAQGNGVKAQPVRSSTSNSSRSSAAAALATKWSRRFGDEETERISRIMMGKFSSSFSASE